LIELASAGIKDGIFQENMDVEVLETVLKLLKDVKGHEAYFQQLRFSKEAINFWPSWFLI